MSICGGDAGGARGRLHNLLTRSVDWGKILEHIRKHPEEAKDRHFRNESPLQSALKAKDRKCVGSAPRTERIDVLQALVDADPSCISHRDEEGRTCLHTACAAGRSGTVLQWLINTEERVSHAKMEAPERNVTLRTDFPSGLLPLHCVATSAVFDVTFLDRKLVHQQDHPLNIYPVQCKITPNIVSAYDSTTVIWRAYPGAVWGRDCEGETPLHSAASWGSVGSVLSLLVGIAVTASVEGRDVIADLARAALLEDDRKKSPLDRACERVCATCVHRTHPVSSVSQETQNASLRRSIARDDPFQTTVSADNSSDRRSLLRNSRVGSARNRIPGCGSSFRSSLSSSLVGWNFALDLDEDDANEPLQQSRLRSSFVSPRRQIDPIRGLKPLDSDGEEQLAKVEMLAKAASLTETILTPTLSESTATNILTASPFQFLHATIALGCPPEIIFHVAAKNQDQVLERDESGRTPLFVACERLASVHSRSIAKVTPTKEPAETRPTPSTKGTRNEVTSNQEDATGVFVQSLLLGESCGLLDSPGRSAQPVQAEQQEQQMSASCSSNDSNSREDDQGISLAHETIRLLLNSQTIGRPEMAATPNDEGRLPLHVVLEAGFQWSGANATSENNQGKSLVETLVDVFPRALDAKDPKTGLLPFMIAATASTELGTEDTAHLETVHQLLLAAPNVVAFAT